MDETTTISLLGRFWGSIRFPDGCWEWTGSHDTAGYGRISAGRRGGQHTWKAHALSWEIANGRQVPTGLVLLHSCDNPNCVNPAHLTPDTQLANIADMKKKGRSPRGERHHNAKLKTGQIPMIRRGYLDGMSVEGIADRCGVSAVAIRDVLSGANWRHVSRYDGLQSAIDALAKNRQVHRGKTHKLSRLDDEKVRAIRRRRAEGETQAALAAEYGVSTVTISNVEKRLAWKHVV